MHLPTHEYRKLLANNNLISTFESLKLIKPLWYFHLTRGGYSSWPDPAIVDPDLVLDSKFDSKKSAILEASFILLMRGWVPEKDGAGELSIMDLSYKPSVKDEFRFIRKNFNPVWIIIYLSYCIFTLKNPIQVFYAFFKSVGIKRKPLFLDLISAIQIPKDDGLQLIRQKEIVRIIIPTYNRYDVLRDVFKDLEQQDYSHFSVTVVDQSKPFDESFYGKYKLDINLIRQESPGLWRARNRAIQESMEELIALLDDDSRLNPNWLRMHLKCLDYFDAEISAGVSISTYGAKVPYNYSFYRLSDQLDTGNAVLRRSVFETCGMFDEQFEGMRMGDGEFGLRAHMAGILSISNPEAKRVHLKIAKGGLRQMGSWDALRPTNIINPRPIPSVLYFSRKYFGNQRTVKYLLMNIPFSFTSYRRKGSAIGRIGSFILLIIIFPVVALQIIWSWKRSSKMLWIGSKIPKLV